MNDKEKIGKVIVDYVKYWNKNDMDLWGNLFTDDLDYVNRGGGWWKSNGENVAAHKKIHRILIDKKIKMDFNLQVQKISFLNSETVLFHAISDWPGAKIMSKNSESLQGIITFVIIKNKDSWKIRALHNTLIEKSTQ